MKNVFVVDMWMGAEQLGRTVSNSYTNIFASRSGAHFHISLLLDTDFFFLETSHPYSEIGKVGVQKLLASQEFGFVEEEQFGSGTNGL
jgi:hypothetical protein